MHTTRPRRFPAILAVLAGILVPAGSGAHGAVELPELIRPLLIPASLKNTLPDWSLGKDAPVRWKSATPQPTQAALAMEGLPVARRGTVVLTDKGKPVYRAGDRPGQWNVTLAGTPESPLELQVETEGNVDGLIDPAGSLAAAGFKVKQLCRSNGVSSGRDLYAVATTGHHPVVLAHEWSSGRLGTLTTVTLAYTKKRAARLSCL